MDNCSPSHHLWPLTLDFYKSEVLLKCCVPCGFWHVMDTVISTVTKLLVVKWLLGDSVRNCYSIWSMPYLNSNTERLLIIWNIALLSRLFTHAKYVVPSCLVWYQLEIPVEINLSDSKVTPPHNHITILFKVKRLVQLIYIMHVM
jgi:hypothetical protein